MNIKESNDLSEALDLRLFLCFKKGAVFISTGSLIYLYEIRAGTQQIPFVQPRNALPVFIKALWQCLIMLGYDSFMCLSLLSA